MKALQVDGTGDLVIEKGQIQEVSGVDEVEQRFRNLLRTNKEEWFLDPEEGLEHADLRGKNVELDDVREALEDVADQMEEINEIQDVEMEFDRRTRSLTVFFTAILDNGEELEIEEVV